MKQEQTFPTTSTSFTEDVWEGEGPLENVKDVDNLLENVLDSKNTEEDPSNMKALGGDEEDEVGEHNTNGSELDDPPSRQTFSKSSREKFVKKRGRPRKVAKQTFDGEEECGKVGEDPGWNYGNKSKHFSDLNIKEIHSTDFFDGEETREVKTEKLKKTPKESRTEAPKRKAEGEPLTNSEKKVFKESFNTDKARLAKRQVKFNRAANFLILVEDNVQEGAALTAGKIMAFGRGPLKESFLSEGIRFNAQHFHMHANTYDFTKEIVDGDESEDE